MITFHEGPANQQCLSLKRAPTFLRAVQDQAGKWDALDQISDEPTPEETVHVYHLESERGIVHIDRRDPKTNRRTSSWGIWAQYRYHPSQPGDHITRDKQAWQEWCRAEATTAKRARQTDPAPAPPTNRP